MIKGAFGFTRYMVISSSSITRSASRINFGLKDEYIKLGQLLKATGLVGSGVDAKIVVQEGLVKVNGKVCYMRGKKIVSGDIVEFENEKIEVV